MTESEHFAAAYRVHVEPSELTEPLLKLASALCSPLYMGPVSPERALEAVMNDGEAGA